MRVRVADGLLHGVRYAASPNCDARPPGCEPDLIVVHGISLPPGEFGGDAIERLFTNTLDPQAHPYFDRLRDLRVSAHALIRRDGEVVQFVPFHRRAWHAGESCYAGREDCNDFSIGIELEGTDEQPYAEVQMQRLAALVRALRECYPRLSPDRVVGHSDIAPQRKTDPGPHFDWTRLRQLLAED